MSDPRFRTCGPPEQPIGDAAYYRNVPRDSIILTRFGIEPDQVVTISSNDDGVKGQWIGGPVFSPMHCIYVGTADLWLLERGSQVVQIPLVSKDTPLDTFKLPAPTFVNWPVFDVWSKPMELKVQNRGKEIGHFVARLAGEFLQSSSSYPLSYPSSGYSPGGG